MGEFRIYVGDGEGHILAPSTGEAVPDDTTALRKAAELAQFIRETRAAGTSGPVYATATIVEVWEGNRKVDQVPIDR